MTLYELWKVAPQSHVFVRQENGALVGYRGSDGWADIEVASVVATEYPMYRSVLEVRLAKPV